MTNIVNNIHLKSQRFAKNNEGPMLELARLEVQAKEIHADTTTTTEKCEELGLICKTLQGDISVMEE